EPSLRAQKQKHACIAGLPMTEAKILADKNGAHAEIAYEDLIDKLLRRELREVECERQNHRRIHPYFCEATYALFIGRNAHWSGFRPKNFLRKRFERQGRCNGVKLAGALDGSAQDGLVP